MPCPPHPTSPCSSALPHAPAPTSGKFYKMFYGMSSATAMQKHAGGVAEYRASEGKTVEVPYRGPVAGTAKELMGGIRSACTYVGAKSLKELSKVGGLVERVEGAWALSIPVSPHPMAPSRSAPPLFALHSSSTQCSPSFASSTCRRACASAWRSSPLKVVVLATMAAPLALGARPPGRRRARQSVGESEMSKPVAGGARRACLLPLDLRLSA